MLIIDRFALEAPKTKSSGLFLSRIDSLQKPLIIIHENDMAVRKSASNITGALVLHVDSVNVHDILNHQRLIATQEAVRKLEEVFGR